MPPKERPLYSPARVRDLLAHYGLRADKAFGQNFLIDGNVLRHIVGAAKISDKDTVFEVGPGLGVLTQALAERARQVISVELDKAMIEVLKDTLEPFNNIRLIHQDAMKFDLSKLPYESLLVANLPYNVATPLVINSLSSRKFRRLVFLVQKEVAERLVASPGTAAFGALSLVVAHWGKAEILRDVKPGSFFPPPKVTSSVVRIEVQDNQTPHPELFELIANAFKHRRKTLRKNLSMAGFDKDRLEPIFEALGLEPHIRAEALSLDTFRDLCEKLYS